MLNTSQNVSFKGLIKAKHIGEGLSILENRVNLPMTKVTLYTQPEHTSFIATGMHSEKLQKFLGNSLSLSLPSSVMLRKLDKLFHNPKVISLKYKENIDEGVKILNEYTKMKFKA